MSLTLNVSDLKAVELDSEKLIDDLIEQNITGAFAAVEKPLAREIANAVLQAAFTELNQKLAASAAS